MNVLNQNLLFGVSAVVRKVSITFFKLSPFAYLTRLCLPTHFGYPLITISSYCAYFPVLKTLTFGYTFQRMSSAHFAHLTCFQPNFTSFRCSFLGLVCVFALSLFGVYRFYFILACCAIPSGVCLHTLQAIRLYRRCSLSPVHFTVSPFGVAT